MKSLLSFFGWIKLVAAGNLFSLILTISIVIVVFVFPTMALGIDLFYWGHFKSINLLESANFFSIGCIGIAAYYGLLRVVCFHPLYAVRYHQWLVNSPWELGLPLPKGPLHPVWYDFAFVGIITPISATLTPMESSIVAWLAPATAMAFSMAFFWSVGNLKAKEYPYLYALLFVFPLALNAAVHESFVLMQFGFFFCAAIAYLGVRSSLINLREQQAIDFKRIAKSMNQPISSETWSSGGQGQQGNDDTSCISWPYEQLLIPPKEFRKSLTRAWLHSLIVMIWAFLFYQMAKIFPGRDSISIQYLFWYFAVFGIALFRFACGFRAICPRLCIGERTTNRKLFLAKHDRLIYEPLAIIACCYVPVALGIFLSEESSSDEWHRIGLMIGPIIGTFMHHTMGKPIEDSFYTGPQSIGPAYMNGAKQKQFAKLAAPGD